ncbi:MAG: hypothetical protein ACLT8C_09470 [Akkermansia muciniphila]
MRSEADMKPLTNAANTVRIRLAGGAEQHHALTILQSQQPAHPAGC